MLVFNWHEPYICLFAHTGHTFHVSPPLQAPDQRLHAAGRKSWDVRFRPLPQNVVEVNAETAVQKLNEGAYDLVVCLTLQDVVALQQWDVPRLFVMLNMIGTDAGLSGAQKQAYVERLRPLFKEVDLSFISEKKRRDWGWEAPVVVSGIDPDDYGDYSGEWAKVIRVGNMLKERDHMQGFSIQEQILGDQFPSSVIGVNPTVPAARPSENWQDLKEQYRRHRLLLNTLTDGHEDGYNLGMLEAMATGMPVVSTPNSSSPIIDGYNGFISDDAEYLRAKIRLLLTDREAAVELGRNARQTVIEHFHINTCAAGWDRLFAESIARWEQRHGRPSAPAAQQLLPLQENKKEPQVDVSVSLQGSGNAPAPRQSGERRLKILLAAAANPLSTSAYYERALRRSHDVLTCGPRIDQKTMGQWKVWEDQHALKPSGVGDADKMGLLEHLVRDCDIPLPWGQINADEVMRHLPQGWQPDLVLWIDNGAEFILLNPAAFACPSACMLIDTHTGQRDWRVEYARQFDQVFVAHRQDIPAFEQAGCQRVSWLPVACEPQIHRHFDVAKAYDIVFVGQTLPQWHGDRVRLLERLRQAGLDLRVDSKVLEEMALLFGRGRIVFNRSINDDLNMRVFEALACGSLLLTDRLSANTGMAELFEDGKHLVCYGEEDLEERARYYLDHEEEAKRIAAAGRSEVLARHTYGHRADTLLATALGGECASCVVNVEVEDIAPSQSEKVVARASVIMPVFNQAEYTEKCLLTLAANGGADPDFELVIVDNGSSDWTRYLLNAFEGDIKILRNDLNLGFARANNQGAATAQGEYLVFLNNDTIPHPGWLREMVAMADSDPAIGIVGAQLLYPDSQKIQHAGIEMQNGIPEHAHRGVEANDPRVNQARDLDMVTGACMLVRADLFQRLEGFDVAYLNGVEDVDLCLQVRELGYRVVYCADAVVEHYEGTSAGRFDKVRENLEHFVQKWQGRFEADGRLRVEVEMASATTVEIPSSSPAFSTDLKGYWEGSFFLHSSLAYVNRELVLALLQQPTCDLGLVPFEGQQFGADEDPRFGVLAERFGHQFEEVDFHLRHRWPPDFSRPTSGKLILMQPWEYGRLPINWIEPLRTQVDQVWAYTNYVRQCYIDSGIEADKVKVVPLGVDVERFKPGLEKLPLPTEKSFKFLFVGGTLARKGIDSLLEAYRTTFSPDDDVCLVIKDMGITTFYSSHHAGEQIRALQRDPTCPEIVYMTEDLPGEQIAQLYAACDCLVHPYRGEGFGLPVSEAMACALPVIVTAGGACDDFCTAETAYMVQAKRVSVRFEEETAGSAWLLNPDLDHLKHQLRHVFENSAEAQEVGRKAAAYIAANLTWEKSAVRARQVLEDLCGGAAVAPLRIAAPVAVEHPTVVVLGGTGSDDVSGISAALGGEVKRYDVTLSPDLSIGEQLEAVRQDSQGEFFIVLRSGVHCSTAVMGRLVDYMRRETRIALIAPCLEIEEQSEELEEMAFLPSDCLIVRHSVLEAMGGFEIRFRTEAVFDELARLCRRQGLAVVRAGDCLVERGAPSVDDEMVQQERRAVHLLEEGDQLKLQGARAAATEKYREAVAAKGDLIEGIMVLSAHLLEEGQAAEAVEVIRQLVEIDRGSVQAHNYLGLVQYQAQQWDEARQSFGRVLEIEPVYIETLINLSVLEWEQGEIDSAIDYLEQAAEIDPANREVIVNTGLIQAQTGNIDASIELFRGYAQHHPHDLEVKAHLADILVQNGNMDDAFAVAEQILKMQPNHPRARAVLERRSGEEKEEE